MFTMIYEMLCKKKSVMILSSILGLLLHKFIIAFVWQVYPLLHIVLRSIKMDSFKLF